MKKLNIFQLSMTLAGCFLGAGYVSGQELWQFFGSYGKPGFLGFLLAMILLFLFCLIILHLANKRNLTDMAEIVIPYEIPWLRTIFGITQVTLLFGIYIIMSAGAASLLEQMLHIPPAVGGGIFCVLVLFLALRGMDGMVRIFSWIVPALVVSTLILGGYLSATHGFSEISADSAQNPLLGSWIFSACTYVSYNLFGSLGILAPLGGRIVSKKTLVLGVLSGTVLLCVIAVAILGALWAVPDATSTSLPMLQLACELNMGIGYFYAALLFSGMFGTSLSSTLAADVYLREHIPFFRKCPRLPIILLSLFAWVCSLFGFSELVGFIYPIFGYFGLLAIVGILLHFFKYSKKNV